MPRAPRGGSWKAEYAQRIERYKRRHPGASRSAARGHVGAGEREAERLLRAIRRLPPESQISFTGTDRQPDGTWRRARFDLFPGSGAGEPPVFEIPEEALFRLPEIRDAIAATGFGVLGATYLDGMAAAFEQEPPPVFAIESPKSGRLVRGVSKRGNALTTDRAELALLGHGDEKTLRRFFVKYPQLKRRGYRIVAL